MPALPRTRGILNGVQRPPVIIGGFYRSGTSLLRRILDSHSGIHCGPEVKFMRDFFGDYPHDPLAHVRLFATARTYGLPEDHLLATFGRAFVTFHEEAAAAAGKARWADKAPENVLFLDAWRTVLPAGFRFIELVRDPLDALTSLDEIGFPKTVPASLADRVALYAHFREAGTRQLRNWPKSSIQVSYESLVTSPQRTVQALMDWLGEPFEANMLQAINSPERRRGIEDPKAHLHATVHAHSVGRGLRQMPTQSQHFIREQLAPYLATPHDQRPHVS